MFPQVRHHFSLVKRVVRDRIELSTFRFSGWQPTSYGPTRSLMHVDQRCRAAERRARANRLSASPESCPG